MTIQTVVAFPGRDYESWISWVECELAILGFDIAASDYDWRAVFDKDIGATKA